jgi:prepilin-type N-terminal cleavage/methylation domain-containing protein
MTNRFSSGNRSGQLSAPITMKTMNMKPIHHHELGPRSGFSLMEVLIVIAIIAVLAVLSLAVVSRMRLAAAKAGSVSQMRNISVGIASWMTDKSAQEPFYTSNGTGDYPHESARASDFRPGNPARALYRLEDPSSGYIQDFHVFFSPLTKLAGQSPTISNYDPAQASESRFWGTYSYHFPHVTEDRRTSRQAAMNVAVVPASGNSANGKLVLSEFYKDDWGCSAKFGKNAYHALLADWSVRHIADNDKGWTKWKTGK